MYKGNFRAQSVAVKQIKTANISKQDMPKFIDEFLQEAQLYMYVYNIHTFLRNFSII